MKCFLQNKIIEVTADVEDAEYPATNVLRHVNDPTEPYRSTGQAGTLTMRCSGGASGLGLAGMVGNSLTVTVYSVPPDQLSLEDDLFGADGDLFGADDAFFVTRPVFEKTYSLSGIDSWYKWFTQTGTPITGLTIEYPYQSSEHTVVVSIDTGLAEKAAEIAVASVSPVRVWNDPVNLTLTPIDYSIKGRYHSGGLYYVKDNITRSWSGSIYLDDESFMTWMNDIALEIGATPVFWNISNENHHFWTTFAGFDPLPSVSMGLSLSLLSFGLTEEV